MPDDLSPSPSKRAEVALRDPSIIDDCWNRIGIRGDGSCPELKQFDHCRNCPVFVSAGLQLLDRDSTETYREERTRWLAESRETATREMVSALVFRIAQHWLALPTRLFQEITESRTIHSLPHRQHGIVLGLVNVRGDLMICVSLARLLDLENRPAASRESRRHHRLLVLHWNDNSLVFPVDEVRGVHRYHPSELAPVPGSEDGLNHSLLHGLLPRSNAPWIGCLNETQLLEEVSRGLS